MCRAICLPNGMQWLANLSNIIDKKKSVNLFEVSSLDAGISAVIINKTSNFPKGVYFMHYQWANVLLYFCFFNRI